MTETVKFLPQSQGGRRNINFGNMGRDINAQSFTVVSGEVVDVRRREAIARYSKAAHFDFSTTPSKTITPNRFAFSETQYFYT